MVEQIYTQNVFDAPPDEPVCWCSNVSKQTILQVITAGAGNLDDIRRMTQACTLGRCKELNPRGRCCSQEIKLLLDAVHHEKE